MKYKSHKDRIVFKWYDTIDIYSRMNGVVNDGKSWLSYILMLPILLLAGLIIYNVTK